MKKWLYEILYRFPIVPIDWIFGPTSQIEGFVEQGIEGLSPPGRAITLGCGIGRETIYLARKGFNVIGLDFSPTAIQRARQRAKAAGVEVEFIQEDITKLSQVSGTFDLITDFGLLNDISQKTRDLYMQTVVPLANPDARYLMFCFDRMLSSKEVTRRFEEHFSIKTLMNKSPGLVYYSMTKK